jgi:hypothetical protein
MTRSSRRREQIPIGGYRSAPDRTPWASALSKDKRGNSPWDMILMPGGADRATRAQKKWLKSQNSGQENETLLGFSPFCRQIYG